MQDRKKQKMAPPTNTQRQKVKRKHMNGAKFDTGKEKNKLEPQEKNRAIKDT